MPTPSHNRYLAPTLRSSLAILVAVVLVTATLAGTALVAAGAPVQQPGGEAIDGDASVQDGRDVPAGEPANGTYWVELHPREPGEVRIEVAYRYAARSPGERRRAENDTLETDWFRGEAIVRNALRSRESGEPTTERPFRSVNTYERDGQHRITVSYRVTWSGFMEPDRERAVLGPEFASALAPGDELRVRLDHPDWSNWTVNRDEPYSAGEASQTYRWTIGDDPEPRVVLRREEADGVGGSPMGPGVQFLLPLGALAAVAVAVAVRDG